MKKLKLREDGSIACGCTVLETEFKPDLMIHPIITYFNSYEVMRERIQSLLQHHILLLLLSLISCPKVFSVCFWNINITQGHIVNIVPMGHRHKSIHPTFPKQIQIYVREKKINNYIFRRRGWRSGRDEGGKTRKGRGIFCWLVNAVNNVQDWWTRTCRKHHKKHRISFSLEERKGQQTDISQATRKHSCEQTQVQSSKGSIPRTGEFQVRY